MNLTLPLHKALSLWPEQEGVGGGGKRFTYREFGLRVHSLAAALAREGLARGDVVAILAPNVTEYLEVYHACAISGVILNSVNFRLSPREISAILEDSGAKLLFVHPDFSAKAAESTANTPLGRQTVVLGEDYEALAAGCRHLPFSPPELNAEDPAHLYYTSGTTGKPKGVVLTHGNVATHALGTIAELKLTDGDVWAHAAPLFHLADAWAAFAITWAGGRHVLLDHFDPAGLLELFEQERITITNLIPTMLNLMVNDPTATGRDYGSLRLLLSGGAPIAPRTVARIIETFGCDYVQTYGMTETSPYLTLSLVKNHQKGLCHEKLLAIKSRTGRPFISVELKVVREDGSEVEADDTEVGEIIVKGPTVTPGYWKNPEATAEAIRGGWLHTGDLAVIDGEGYVNIVDRKKDMIITGGENVYSTEVEYVLYEHPGVLECAVIGTPDEKWGEAVTACVVLKPGVAAPAESELASFVKERLAHYKAPKIVRFLDALPRTGSGKIYKKGLR